MSWEALGWVWRRDIQPAARKLIAVAIADAANDEGLCWLKHQTLAVKCGLSCDSVRRHVRELESCGVLVREAVARDDGSQGANEYRVTPWEPVPTPLGTGSQGGVGTCAHPNNHLTEEPENKEKQGALFETPAPENVVWEHWLKASGTRQKFDPTRKRLTQSALKLRTVEQCCQAIDGYLGDPWWRENRPTLELRYALRGNHAKGEADEDRIDSMIAKARAGPVNVKGAVMGVSDLLERFPAEHRHRVEPDMLAPINAMLANPDDKALEIEGQRALRRLRDFGYEAVIENGKITGGRVR